MENIKAWEFLFSPIHTNPQKAFTDCKGTKEATNAQTFFGLFSSPYIFCSLWFVHIEHKCRFVFCNSDFVEVLQLGHAMKKSKLLFIALHSFFVTLAPL